MRTAAALLLTAVTAAAQSPADVREIHNAALAYAAAAQCMTFPTDEQSSLGSKIASGQVPWDEKTMGPLLDANWEALHLLREGSRQPSCDFHLSYSQGFASPLPHLRFVRALSRLNAWDACRDLALFRGDAAADAFIAGLRFAAHVGSDGPVIQGLVGNAILGITTEPLHRAIADRLFDVPTLRRIEVALRGLPPDVVDWNRAMACERLCNSTGFDLLLDPKNATDFFAALKEIGADGDAGKEGEPVKQHSEFEQAMARHMFRTWADSYLKFFDRQAAAMARPWPEADARLRRLDARLVKECVLTRLLAAAMTSVNESRGRAAAARNGLIILCVLARAEETAEGDRISLEKLDVPPDPFTGGSFDLDQTVDGFEVRAAGTTADDKPIVYRLKSRQGARR